MDAGSHLCVYLVLSNSISQYEAQEITWKLKLGAALVDDLGRLGKVMTSLLSSSTTSLCFPSLMRIAYKLE